MKQLKKERDRLCAKIEKLDKKRSTADIVSQIIQLGVEVRRIDQKLKKWKKLKRQLKELCKNDN